MKILQTPISEIHKSAMFFNGVIAEDQTKECKLITFQSGEIEFMDKLYIGEEISELGQKGILDDNDIDNEEVLDILVDKFFTIEFMGNVIDDLLYDNYDDAIINFQTFLITI